jgi:predicted nucleic-acid-binding Zn-ribbon protein
MKNSYNKQMNNLFETQLHNFIFHISYSRYIIQLTKCCGYSEFIILYKEMSLQDIYKTVCFHYGISNQENTSTIQLYVVDKDIILNIPNDSNTTLYQFISSHSSFFVPVYPLPTPLVYTIFCDDGHILTCKNTKIIK